jgi:phage shock protein PspC (stress-responsive transcriptional regulator)
LSSSLWPDWRASLADASFSDWITVAAYLIAAVIALRATRTAGHRSQPRERLFWALVTGLLVVLGINELLDLQTVLTAVGKQWSLEQGWYEDRRLYQFEFVLALAILGVIAGLAALWLTRAAHRSVRWALLGLVFIGAFILVRAASFHHVDALLGMGPEAFNWGSVQEMLGIVIVGLAAHRYRAG